MHVPYDTEKFYYGFPVYILAYPDEEVGVGITTGSSSYSLGQMVMIGCDSTRACSIVCVSVVLFERIDA